MAQKTKRDKGKVSDHCETSPAPVIICELQESGEILLPSFREICPSFIEASSLALEPWLGICFSPAALMPPKTKKKVLLEQHLLSMMTEQKQSLVIHQVLFGSGCLDSIIFATRRKAFSLCQDANCGIFCINCLYHTEEVGL